MLMKDSMIITKKSRLRKLRRMMRRKKRMNKFLKKKLNKYRKLNLKMILIKKNK